LSLLNSPLRYAINGTRKNKTGTSDEHAGGNSL
jgi:hypothetical protein